MFDLKGVKWEEYHELDIQINKIFLTKKIEQNFIFRYRMEFTAYDYSDEIPLNKPEFSLKSVFDESYKLFVFWYPCGKNYECKATKPGTSFYVKYR